jgi:hypothetical protein
VTSYPHPHPHPHIPDRTCDYPGDPVAELHVDEPRGLRELSPEQYRWLLASGLMFEVYPEATGVMEQDLDRDLLPDPKRTP